MSCDIVLGGQWGDEGKAKMVDFLSRHYQVVSRYQGGANAGHTVTDKGNKYVFHLLPSGILHESTVCVLGNGMVVNLDTLLQEIHSVESKGIILKDRLKISSKAFLVLDYHILLDRLREEKNNKIGTTIRGIGPAYEDKIVRRGIRVGDLRDSKKLNDKIKFAFQEKKFLLEHHYHQKVDLDLIVLKLQKQYEQIKDYVIDTTYYLNSQTTDKKILLEGAQGTGLDIDFGSYPYVTSSSTISGGACIGSGISPKKIDDIYGVFKSYVTRVGGGVLPTALETVEMEKLRTKGEEFGATTGRERSCGWFDGVQAKYSVLVNGLTGIALTKLDVLSGYDVIKFCTHYEINGIKIDHFPDRIEDFEQARPIYKEFQGWKEDIFGITDFDFIPGLAKEYLTFLQEYIGCPLKFLSTGPERSHTIVF